MRLTITILLFTFVFTTTANVFAHNACADFLVTKMVAKEAMNGSKISNLTRNKTTEGDELKKDVQAKPGYISPLFSRFSYTSVEARHFLDALFVSFFKYFSSYNNAEKHNYFNRNIATNKALVIIYPYHSFW